MRDDDLTWIGRTDFRGDNRPFGIRRADRRAHIYIIGRTGTGKSTLIANLIRQDITNGEGCALLDPHGDLVQQVLAGVPERRQRELTYFDVADAARPLAFNPLDVPPDAAALAVSGLISVFKKQWTEFWGPRMEYILRNALLTLVELPGSTLVDVLRLLNDEAYRRHAIANLRNADVRAFWIAEFERYPARFRVEAIAPIQNKIGELVVDPILRGIIGQPTNALDLRRLMDSGGVLLVNLAKGRIGEDTASLLGGMLVAQFGLAALSRASLVEAQRRDFYLYVDEFPSFTTAAFALMLPEMRKYRLALTLAHQHLAQVDERTREAILGNVGTAISFRISATDAEQMEREFGPDVRGIDFLGLPNYSFNLRITSRGVASRPFSATMVG